MGSQSNNEGGSACRPGWTCMPCWPSLLPPLVLLLLVPCHLLLLLLLLLPLSSLLLLLRLLLLGWGLFGGCLLSLLLLLALHPLLGLRPRWGVGGRPCGFCHSATGYNLH